MNLPDLTEYERAIDARYKEIKDAIKILRGGFDAHQLNPIPQAKEPPKVVSTSSAGTDIHRVRAVVSGMDGDFKKSDVVSHLPDMDDQKVSNSLSFMKQKGEIHMPAEFGKQRPAIYRKGPTPS